MSTSKYSISNTARWAVYGDNPRLTDHALEMWDERTKPWACSPEKAWEHGVDLDNVLNELEDRGGQTPEVARYFEEWHGDEKCAVIFIVNDGVIKTVYKRSFVDSGAVRAYLTGLWNER